MSDVCGGFWRWMTTACVASILTGCVVGCLSSPGSNQWYEKANPETSFKVSPIDKTVSFYTNDGRGLKATKLGYKAVAGTGEKEFVAEGLEITDKSVENRMADAQQALAMGQMFDSINRSLAVLIPASVEAGGNAVRNALLGGAALETAKNDDYKKAIANAVAAYLNEKQAKRDNPTSQTGLPSVLPASLVAMIENVTLSQVFPCWDAGQGIDYLIVAPVELPSVQVSVVCRFQATADCDASTEFAPGEFPGHVQGIDF